MFAIHATVNEESVELSQIQTVLPQASVRIEDEILYVPTASSGYQFVGT